jgi:UDPglucose 6-dehydrogenase
MNIGMIGHGVVGSAVASGLRELGHDISIYDIKYENSSISDISDTEICFICVPTPPVKDTDGCDTSIVKKVVAELNDIGYAGIISIKSTVVPGTTKSLQSKYPGLNISFVPEFLRERCAFGDFTDNHDVCIIGTENDDTYEKIKECHGYYPSKFVKVNPTEAEVTKYFNNVYNSTLIIFANSFYEICKSLGVDYTKIKNAIVNRPHIVDRYLDCNNNLRGFGGVCLPKDLKAIAALCKERNINIDFFETLLKENDKFKTTIYKGMRKE